jgi:hypothetical protein
MALRVRFFEFLFGYDLGVLAFSMFIPLGLANTQIAMVIGLACQI